MALQFAKPRSTITEEGGRLTIVTPAMWQWVLLPPLLAAPLLAGGWCVGLGGDYLGYQERPGILGFETAVCAFTLMYLLVSLAWMLFGREIIRVEDGSLFLKLSILGIGRVRAYPIRHVTGLRVSPGPRHEFYRTWGRDLWNSGAVAFECKGKTHRFGRSLDEVEAKAIIARLEEYTCFWGCAEAGNLPSSGPKGQGL